MPVPTSQQPLMAVQGRLSQQRQSTRNPGADCLFVAKTARTISQTATRLFLNNDNRRAILARTVCLLQRQRERSDGDARTFQQRQSTRNPGADCLFVAKTARTIRWRRAYFSTTTIDAQSWRGLSVCCKDSENDPMATRVLFNNDNRRAILARTVCLLQRQRERSDGDARTFQQRQSTRNPGADCLFVAKSARTIKRRRDVATTNRSKEYFT